MHRENTKKILIGNLSLGGSNQILIQSMCNIKTSNVSKVIKQINECANLGASMMRVSILDDADLNAIKKIKENISIPLICDIHYNLKYAIKAIENGCDAIRINPGNTTFELLDELINVAKKHNAVIRIGLNEGSFKSNENNIAISLVNETLKWIDYFEEREFYSLVLSVKSSNLFTTIEAYKYLNKKTNYPLHIGLTESGFDEIGIIRSISALAPLILEGIGDTIRISLTGDPKKEIIVAKRMLHDLGLYPNYPTLISCPTCGRCKVSNLKYLANETLKYLENNNINIRVAIMGCIVNGIGEGKNADIGLAGANNEFIVFKNGNIIKRVHKKDGLNALFEEIDKFK